MKTLKYLAGYPPHLQAQVQALIDQGRLGALLSDRYGDTTNGDGLYSTLSATAGGTLNVPALADLAGVLATQAGEDPRAGRWRNQEKVECGIHFVGGRIVRGPVVPAEPDGKENVA